MRNNGTAGANDGEAGASDGEAVARNGSTRVVSIVIYKPSD